MLTFFKLASIILLVLANGFFVASEFALVGVRRSRIVAMATSGDTRARRLIGVLDNLSAYISATQLGITLASLALGWIGEPALAQVIKSLLEIVGVAFNQSSITLSEGVLHTVAFGVAFTVIAFMHIVIGELAPKTLALERAERIALLIVWPLEIFYRIFSWPIRFLDWAGTRSVLLLGLKPQGDHGASYTEQELRLLIEASHKSGHLATSERQLIDRVFDFSQTEAHEAMVPRRGVVSLPVSVSLDEVIKAFTTTGYSRLPVYREQMDQVLGVLFMKDLIPYLNDRTREFKVENLLHRAVFIPESAKLGATLKQMQEGRSHLAFVVDEHGGIEGIVTLEDLLEEIVGEIDDEYDDEALKQIVKDEPGYLLDGMIAIRDLNRQLNLNLPEDAGYNTLAGFMLARAGRLMRSGESIEHDGNRFTVERMERRQILKVRLVPRTLGSHPKTA